MSQAWELTCVVGRKSKISIVFEWRHSFKLSLLFCYLRSDKFELNTILKLYICSIEGLMYTSRWKIEKSLEWQSSADCIPCFLPPYYNSLDTWKTATISQNDKPINRSTNISQFIERIEEFPTKGKRCYTSADISCQSPHSHRGLLRFFLPLDYIYS